MEKKVTATIVTLEGTKEIEGTLTTDHAASSYGKPVFVDAEGNAYDSWQVREIREVE